MFSRQIDTGSRVSITITSLYLALVNLYTLSFLLIFCVVRACCRFVKLISADRLPSLDSPSNVVQRGAFGMFAVAVVPRECCSNGYPQLDLQTEINFSGSVGGTNRA